MMAVGEGLRMRRQLAVWTLVVIEVEVQCAEDVHEEVERLTRRC